MRAHKLAVTIPATRRFEVVLPEDVLPGEAEVIVLVRESTDVVPRFRPGSRDAVLDAERAVDAWRAQHADQLLSKEAIDHDLAVERASWGDDP
jgi:hypothetical protein